MVISSASEIAKVHELQFIPTVAANSLIRRSPPSEERSPPLKFILIFLLLSSEMVFRIVIEDLFLGLIMA